MCLYVEFAENGSVGSYIEARLGKPEKERAWAWGKEIAEGRTLASICSETYLWPPPLGCKKVVFSREVVSIQRSIQYLLCKHCWDMTKWSL